MHVPGAHRRASASTATASGSTCSSASTRRRGTCSTTPCIPTGVILYDDSRVRDSGGRTCPAPARCGWTSSRRRSAARPRAKNMVAVGAVSAVISFDTTPIEEFVLRRFAHKQGVADANIAALNAGAARPPTWPAPSAITAAVEVEEDRILISGNQAISVGAVAAGVRLLRRLPDHPGLGHPRVAVGPSARRRRHHDPVRGRDRVAVVGDRRLVHGRPGDDRHLRPRACRS